VPPRPGGLDELRREALNPPVDGDVIDQDAALGEQFLYIAVGQAVAQVPADGQGESPQPGSGSQRTQKTIQATSPDQSACALRSASATVPCCAPGGCVRRSG
jgi:hypothetical protein